MTTITQPFKKGYKFPIYPTKQQKELFEKTFGCCRFVYNHALAEAKREYESYLALREVNPFNKQAAPGVSGYDFVYKLTKYKTNPDFSWLNDCIAVPLQQSMLHLGGAFNRFFKAKKGYPKFKKKYGTQSFSLMNVAFRFKDTEFYVAKSKEPLKIVYSRPLPSVPSSCTISRTSTGKYFISFICEYTPSKTSGTSKVGIDLGIKTFATLSDGTKIDNPKYFKHAERRLRRLQQSLSRKQKGSRNRNKARHLVARQHENVANARRNFQHQLSRRLVNENQVIGLEKLVVKNMVKNHHLSKSISDASWASFTQILEYKTAESQHSTLVYMDTFFPSSHLCSETGKKLDRKLDLKEREWTCLHCGQTHDRDVNAAINIQKEALKALKDFDAEQVKGKIVLSTARY